MLYYKKISSPLGEITLRSDGQALTGLWFADDKHYSDKDIQDAKILQNIPYGSLITYGDIAREIAAQRGLARMSAQAVGGAVGRNPLCIIIPCHRVIGADGSLTGYGGGMCRKVRLLELEKIDMSKLTVPTKGTAL